MRITRVRIHNYRSLKAVDVNLEDYTSLIGRNDSGKSSFLRALLLLFDPESECSDDDVCKIDPDTGAADCYVEATLDGPDLEDGKPSSISIRRHLSEKARWEVLGNVPKLDVFRDMQAGTLTKGVYDKDDAITETIRSEVGELPGGKVPIDFWKSAYDRLNHAGYVEHIDGWSYLDPAELPKIAKPIMLQADVRAEDEITDRGQTIFAQLGGLLVQAAIQNHTGLQNALSTLRNEITLICAKDETGQWSLGDINRLESVLQEELTAFDPAVTVSTALTAPKVPPVSFGISVQVKDDWIDGLSNMGHGLRRSLVFAMLRTLGRLREVRSPSPPENTDSQVPLHLFLIEEPELYLHPQAERQRMQELLTLATQPDTQVVLCTHSAFFVDLSHYKGILRFTRPDRKATSIHCWKGGDLDPTDKKTLDTTYHFDPSRAAMLFADLVILVEGQTEKVTVPPLAEKLGLDTRGVEMVDCGGNQNIPTYQRVLEEFDVKYVAWLDTDDMDPVKKARKLLTPLNGRIVLTEVNWERIAKLGGSGDKPFRSWKKFIFDAEEPTSKMVERIKAAYEWREFPVPTQKKRKDEALDGISI